MPDSNDAAAPVAKCHRCAYRREVPGDHHLTCVNYRASVKINPHGWRNGWAYWPLNFDPVWIECRDGFKPMETEAPTGAG